MLKLKQSSNKLALGVFVILYYSCVFAATQERELLSKDVQTSMHTSIINPIEPHLVFNTQNDADAWLSDMSRRLRKWVPDEFLRKRYLTIIQYEATRAALDPQLVLSVIAVESRFNKYAISPSGARGMMQVMPFWPITLGMPQQDLFDVRTNIRYGCTILRYYLQREHGDKWRALARYNGSLGQLWYPTLVFNTYDNYWQLYPILTIKHNKVEYTKFNN